MSFRNSPALAALRVRTSELTSQTFALRGRAAAGVIGGATMGVLALGSAMGAVASTTPTADQVQTVAGVAGVGKGGHAAVDQLTDKAGKAGKTESTSQKATGTVAGEAGDAQEDAGSAKDANAGAKAATAQEVIGLAKKQVGISEGKGGQTKFHDWYVGTDNAKLTAQRDGGNVSAYNGAQWCNMFVSWVGAQTGVKGMGWDAYTVQHAMWFKKTGRWGQEPKPGAVVFFAWNGGGISSINHVGLVVKDNGDGTIDTVEGNTGNAVKEKTRKVSQVAGYGYPDYRGK
ncbi:CHAP domain-containing protein [Actinomadura sp. 9N407]|uniref:CHAP domain-containing protein n=1 Tax=Actinomadura sp. 9N407 TaxID=3375154 RepID=UPI0037997213